MSETSATESAGTPTPGKGRPTPKRSDGQRSRGPVAPPPTTRREAAKRVRAQSSTKGAVKRRGIAEGDEKYLLARDAGPTRRLVRDVVDARRNAAVLLLPASVLPLGSQLLGNQNIARYFTTLWLAVFLIAAADVMITIIRVRTTLKRDLPQERVVKHAFYAVMRCVTFRKFRLPKPQVAINAKV